MLTENLAVKPLDEAHVDEAQERLVTPAPVLITAHEVALGTAVALQARPTTRRRWVEATHVLLVALNRGLAPSTQDGFRTRRNYPKHYSYLENACLVRAMNAYDGSHPQRASCRDANFGKDARLLDCLVRQDQQAWIRYGSTGRSARRPRSLVGI